MEAKQRGVLPAEPTNPIAVNQSRDLTRKHNQTRSWHRKTAVQWTLETATILRVPASRPSKIMLQRIWQLISSTFIIWGDANASRMSAALTYYTMLSLAPLLMITIAIAGYVYDDQAAQAEIIKQVELLTSPVIAETVGRLIANAVQPGSGIVAGSISLCIFVFAASGVFTQIYDTFNDIWDVSQDIKRPILFTIQKRLLGVAMVVIMGVMLTVALLLNSAVAYINTLVVGHPTVEGWINLADRSLSYLLMPVIFSLVFWFFPATKIKWQDVWPAGILTSLLVGASRYLIGIYLEFSTTSEVYGVSGSLVVLLIWVYMTGLVVFLGASFSHAWADTFGSRSDFGGRTVRSRNTLVASGGNSEMHESEQARISDLATILDASQRTEAEKPSENKDLIPLRRSTPS
jgi:membrane protein